MSEVQGRGPVVRVAPRVLGASVVTLAGGSLFVGAQPVQAATITVTNAGASGAGSLRQAIIDANSSSGPDTITITATGTLSINYSFDAITEDLTIQGPGSTNFTIDGNQNACDVFYVDTAGIDLSISGIRIFEVYCDAIDVNSDGGTLTLDDVDITRSYDRAVETDQLVDVTVTDSSFTYSGGSGLFLYRQYGPLTITNSLANANGQFGVFASDVTDLTIADSTFDRNGRSGVRVRGVSGAAIVSSSYFNMNTEHGLYAEYWTSTVSITYSRLSANLFSGLHLVGYYGDPSDEVTISDVLANNNKANGIRAVHAGSLTITDSVASSNYQHGLYAKYVNGAVTITDSSFDTNRSTGVRFSDTDAFDPYDSLVVTSVSAIYNIGEGITTSKVATVSISDSTVRGNSADGIDIYATGIEVSMSQVTSMYNQEAGLEVDIASDRTDLVSISDSTLNYNGASGANVQYADVLTVSGTTVSSNSYYGLYAKELGEATVTASTFAYNSYAGLKLYAVDATVSVVDVTAADNGAYGVYLLDAGDVTVTGLTTTSNDESGLMVANSSSAVVTGSTFTDDRNEGLEFDDIAGDVTVRDVVVSGSGNQPLYLDTVDGSVLVESSTFVDGGGSTEVNRVAGDVTFRDVEVSSTAGYDGMLVASVAGTVLLERVTVADADGDGLTIDDASVTVLNSTITGSGYSGVEVDSGDVTIEQSTIADSYSSGLLIEGAIGSVVSSTITGNGDAGVQVYSGDVTVEHSTITGNGDEGVSATAGSYQSVSGSVSLGSPQAYAFVPAAATLTVDHSIVSGNGSTDVVNESEANAAPDQGTTTVTWSLVDVGSEHAGGSNVEADDPKLGALADNGGVTRTMLPADDSPVLSAGDPAISGAPDTDQRGVDRVVNRIEIGAVESELNQGVLAVEVPGSVSEDDDGITLVVSRTGGSDGAVSATLRSCDGTELTVSWADGESADQAVTFPVPEGFAGQDCVIEVVGSTGGLALGEVASFPVPVTGTGSPTTTAPTTPTTTIPTPVTLPPTGGGSSSGVVAWMAAVLVGVGGVFARTTRRRRSS